jgi:hypothetical protein
VIYCIFDSPFFTVDDFTLLIFQARKVLKKFGMRTKNVGEAVVITSASALLQKAPLSREGCPQLTRALEEGISHRWPVIVNAR